MRQNAMLETMIHGITRHPQLNLWVVTDPTLARQALGEERLASGTLRPMTERYLTAPAREGIAPLTSSLSSWFVLHDGPSHRRLRRGALAGLSGKYLRELEPVVRGFVAQALSDLETAAVPDTVPLVTDAIPAQVMTHLLGMGSVEVPTLYRWTRAIASFFDAVYRPDAAAEAYRAVKEIGDVLKDRPPRRPGASSWEDHLVPDVELRLSTLSMILFAGLETTASLLASALHHVVATPGSAARIRTHGARAAADTVEQVLRDQPPLSHVARVAVEDLTLGGARIAAGEFVLVSLTGRDVMARTQQQCPGRAPDDTSMTMAFGHSRHYCPGASLARLEAVVLLQEFCARFPHAGLLGSDSTAWNANATYPRLRRLLIDTGPPVPRED
ncbi:hypothetical protein [Streptomyces sp. NPDC050255]|uniref:hypothetical protein n=1 Tax=Streptomyces sp. NPDC050255 TaxID=3365606 RepID=UPI0037B78513